MKQTTKERKEAYAAQERAKQTSYESMTTSPRPRTWSATMPAYCYTVLCADKRYRLEGGETIGQGDTRPVL